MKRELIFRIYWIFALVSNDHTRVSYYDNLLNFDSETIKCWLKMRHTFSYLFGFYYIFSSSFLNKT